MRIPTVSLATLVLASSYVFVTACSAESENATPPPVVSAGMSGVVSGSSSLPGSAGTMGEIPSVGGGGTTGFAGAAPVAGGGPVLGTSGSGPILGSAGAPPSSGGCVMAVGSLTDLVIDNLDDGDNKIQALGSRSGYWYTYNDKSAAQVPAPAGAGGTPFLPTAGGHSPTYEAKTSGPAFTVWGAGMGFDFNNTSMKSCAYNASVYSGIKFWAKGNAPIKAMVKIPATTLSTSDSGACSGMGCEDHFYYQPTPAGRLMLTSTWTQYTITFADATTFAQEGWGTKATFDKSNIIAVQFQVGMGVPFDFSVDDITFF